MKEQQSNGEFAFLFDNWGTWIRSIAIGSICVPIVSIDAQSLSTGEPATGGGVFWVDQSVAVPGFPDEFQKWGEVFTIPPDQEFLNSLNVFVAYVTPGPPFSATYFGVTLTQWSSELDEPIGGPIFESSPIFPPMNSDPYDTSALEFPQTIVDVDTPVTPDGQYILEFIGDGAVGIVFGQVGADGGLYATNGGPWIFDEEDEFRTDIFFGDSTATPIGPSPGVNDEGGISLMVCGIAALFVIGRFSRLKDVIDARAI